MPNPWSDPVVRNSVLAFYEELDDADVDAFDAVIERLCEVGPGLGRPTVDTLDLRNARAPVREMFGNRLKELRIGTLRVLFTFGPDRVPVLLVAGDKRGEWDRWYSTAIDQAAREYDDYLREEGLG